MVGSSFASFVPIAKSKPTMGLLSELKRAVQAEHPGARVVLGAACADDEVASSALGSSMQLLQRPEAAELVRRISVFVARVLGEPGLTGDALALSVRAFYFAMDERLVRHPLWQGATPTALDGARDAVEQLLMGRLHTRALPPSAADAEQEARARRRALCPLLTPDRLGMPAMFAQDAPWAEAQAELSAMSMYATPRNKCTCLLNCCARLNLGLAARGGGHGADEFLPALVTVMLHCPLRPLAASIAYAGAYRHPLRLEADGESRCYLTHALSALEFIRTCGASQLVGVSPRAFAVAMAVGLRGAALEEAEAVTAEERSAREVPPLVARGGGSGLFFSMRW
ncbi:hypothetical protein T492DRAFT_1002756 [Pavlovales sp. CCMP2436]|nr:hypothetical protein T492DRAFT_1002756 [Pavlovales sp. CCMP2436]